MFCECTANIVRSYYFRTASKNQPIEQLELRLQFAAESKQQQVKSALQAAIFKRQHPISWPDEKTLLRCFKQSRNSVVVETAKAMLKYY